MLDKTALYARCERLDVPYHETYRLAEPPTGEVGPPVRTAAEAATDLGFPLVFKPARKRAFEELARAKHESYREYVDVECRHGRARTPRALRGRHLRENMFGRQHLSETHPAKQ